MRPIEQVYELVKRAGTEGITVSEIQVASVPDIGKKPWGHRSRAKTLVQCLVASESVRLYKNRVTYVEGMSVPRFDRTFAAGHETEVYDLLAQSGVLSEVLAHGEKSDATDDVSLDRLELARVLTGRNSLGLQLALPDFIGMTSRDLGGVCFTDVHAFEIKVKPDFPVTPSIRPERNSL